MRILARKVKPTPEERPTLADTWRPKFLASFEVSFNWTASARAAGITRQTAQAAYNNDPAFKALVDEAKEAAIDGIELSAVNRAVTGQSDRMTEFMLKSHRRPTYDPPQRHQITGADGGPLRLDLARTLDTKLSDLARRVFASGTESTPRPDSGAAGGGPEGADSGALGG